jgi:hypothetical protein
VVKEALNRILDEKGHKINAIIDDKKVETFLESDEGNNMIAKKLNSADPNLHKIMKSVLVKRVVNIRNENSGSEETTRSF